MTGKPGSWRTEVVVSGQGAGPVLCLDEPLSLWGGLDPHDGTIIDARHPQCGEVAAGQVVVMPTGRGSSSASSILIEAVREGTAPAAFVLGESDDIIALGAVVASELYGVDLPVVVAAPDVLAALQTGMHVELTSDGALVPTLAPG